MFRHQQFASEGVRVQIGNGIQSSYRPPTGIVIGGSHYESVVIGFGHDNQLGYYSEDRSWQGQDRSDRCSLGRRFGR